MRNYRMMAAVAVGMLAVWAGGAAMKDPFEGKWKITATADGMGKGFDDVLSFKGGQFTPAELVKKGWAAGPYEDDVRQGGVAQFKATIKHPKEGEMNWTGSITASEIRGNIVWKNADGDEARYSYSGTKN